MTGQAKKLHLGCGLNTPAGWIHIDGSWNARLAKHPLLQRIVHALPVLPEDSRNIPWNPHILIHDLRRRLPFGDDCIQAIYSSHVLEHLYLQEAKNLLQECARVLVPGGVLRVVVPDLRSIVSEYLVEVPSGRESKDAAMMNAADRLNKRLMLRRAEGGWGNVFWRIYSAVKDFHSHKWMYDADSLVFHFREAGFMHARERKFLESQIAGIEGIEKGENILNGEGVCVEGLKLQSAWGRKAIGSGRERVQGK